MTTSKIDLSAINALNAVRPEVKPGVTNPLPSGKPPGSSSKYGSKPGVFTFYKLDRKSEVEPGKFNYQIKKFNMDLEIESSYPLTYIPSNNGGYYSCSCPGSEKRFDCRHKGIMKAIIDANEVDSQRFFCFETKTFQEPFEIGRHK